MGRVRTAGVVPFLSSAPVALGLTALVCVVSYLAARTTLLTDFEYRGYDVLVNTGPYPASDDRVVAVDFDDESLQHFGTFPLPRARVAEAVTAIAAGKPDLIGLDLLLSEPRPGTDDDAMAASLRAAGNVVVASFYDARTALRANPLPAFCTPDPAVPSACDERSAAFGVGMVNMPVDEDGFIRRFFVLPPAGYGVLPLPIALATNFAGKPLTRAGEAFRVGDTILYPDRHGDNTALIGAWSRSPARTISATAVMAPGFDARIFKGKIVLVGQSNTAAGDRHFTPLFRSTGSDGKRLLMPGTQVMAAALTSALRGVTIRRIGPRPQWAVTAVLLFVALVLLLQLSPAAGVTWFIAAGATTYVAAQLAFSLAHTWFPFITTEAALMLALPAGYGYRFVRERFLKSAVEAERRQLMGIFSKYVSPEVATEIWNRRGEIVLAGQEKTVTVIFTDIRGFTRKTAGKPSMEVLSWLNDYFSAMTETTQDHGGFVNKFIGDGMMILFGMPLTRGDREDACSAVAAGLAMIERLKRFNAEHAHDPAYPPDLRIGVGIHTGTVVAGNVGARDRLEYSAIGETVNLASRLESASKDVHAELVMSGPTWELIKGSFATAPLGDVEIRGLAGTITLYTATAATAVT